MAEQETTVNIEDRGMLSDLMADREPEPAAPEPVVETPREPTSPDRPRDDAGRFVSKAPDADAAPTQQQATETPATPQAPDEDTAAQVPSWRARELREARDAANRKAEEAQRQAYQAEQRMQDLERRFAELNKPQAPQVDFFENPEDALRQRVEPIQTAMEQRLSELRLDMSRELAVTRHGEKDVSEMEAAVAQAMAQGHPDMPVLAAQMRASKFPALVAMQWHQREKTQREIGGDLNAYKTRLQEELLANPEFLAKAVAKATGQAQQAAAQPGARPNISLPPSINRATGAGLSNSDPTEEADMSDRGLFRHAMGSPRR